MDEARLKRILMIAIPVILVAIIVAVLLVYNSRNRQSGMTIEILQPQSGEVIPIHRDIAVVSRFTTRSGWSRVELRVNGRLVKSDQALPDSPDTFMITQTWNPSLEGPAMLSVTLFDRSGREIAKVERAVLITVSASVTPDIPILPSPTPDLTATATMTPTQQATQAECSVGVTFVGDANLPDGSLVPAGQAFTKSWQVRNSGTCTWENYRIVFIRGNLLGGQTPTAIPNVAPNGTSPVSVNLVAPGIAGTYSGTWRLLTPNGTIVGPDLNFRIIVPQATATRPNTATPTRTLTPSLTPTGTQTPTSTPTATSTSTNTPTATDTATATLTPTLPEATSVPSEDPTATPSATSSPTPTLTPTLTTAVPLPNVINVEKEFNLTVGDTDTYVVSCPANTQVISGGYRYGGNLTVTRSTFDNNGWGVTVSSQDSETSPVTVSAVCARLNTRLLSRVEVEEELEPGESTLSISCSSNRQPLGTGFALSEDGSVRVIAVENGRRGFSYTLQNVTDEDQDVKLSLICVVDRGGQVRTESQELDLPDKEISVFLVTCPQRQSYPIALATELDGGVTLMGSMPFQSGWQLTLANGSESSREIEVHLSCLRTR